MQEDFQQLCCVIMIAFPSFLQGADISYMEFSLLFITHSVLDLNA